MFCRCHINKNSLRSVRIVRYIVQQRGLPPTILTDHFHTVCTKKRAQRRNVKALLNDLLSARIAPCTISGLFLCSFFIFMTYLRHSKWLNATTTCTKYRCAGPVRTLFRRFCFYFSVFLCILTWYPSVKYVAGGDGAIVNDRSLPLYSWQDVLCLGYDVLTFIYVLTCEAWSSRRQNRRRLSFLRMYSSDINE